MQRYNKTLVAIVGAALTWATATFVNDEDISQWLSLATALLTAAGVYQVPNRNVDVLE
jgi:hypothetical protein